MKLSTKLALSFVGVVGVLSSAACTGGVPGFGNPQAAPTAGAPSVSTLPRLIISRVVFNTATDPNQGNHEVYLKNLTNSDIVLKNYALYFHPTFPGGNEASSSIMLPGNNDATVSAGATLRVFLFTAGRVATGSQAVAAGLENMVQYTKGGALAIFDARNATASSNIKDFVQWGQKGTMYENVAQSANLWKAGTTVATTSVTGIGGLNYTVVTEGATGSANWTFTAI